MPLTVVYYSSSLREVEILVLRKPTLEIYGGLGKLDFPKVRSPQNHLNDEPRLTQRDD